MVLLTLSDCIGDDLILGFVGVFLFGSFFFFFFHKMNSKSLNTKIFTEVLEKKKK